MIQAIHAANGRRGIVVEEVPGGGDRSVEETMVGRRLGQGDGERVFWQKFQRRC